MLIFDETEYSDPEDILKVAPLGLFAVNIKLPVDEAADVALVVGDMVLVSEGSKKLHG